MKIWNSIARGTRPGVPAPEMERAIEVLEALEESFRPLVRELPSDLEPAAVFQADEEGG